RPRRSVRPVHPHDSARNPCMVQGTAADCMAGDRQFVRHGTAEGKRKVPMKKRDVIRAWRDGEYYSSLSKAERAEMPESPASVIELGDEVLATVTGGCSY